MSCKFQVSSRKLGHVACVLLAWSWGALAADLSTLCAERAAIERVYYQHRLGTKPPFEETLPQTTLEALVRLDLNKEAVLKKVYRVEITPALLEAEVQRINTTTRAPEMLAEIKAALSNDPVKFAEALARPILVERLLREKFENDDALHATQRRECERARDGLLAAKTNGTSPANLLAVFRQARSNQISELTWQLAARPAETNAATLDELEIKKRFGPDAQMLSSPQEERDRKNYFEDLPGELQRVLRVQLRQAGDVSAVIETPTGFLLYLALGRTEAVLTVASLSLPKRSYEEWLNQYDGGAK